MRKAILILLSLSICTTAVSGENCTARRTRRGQAAGYSSRDATVLSMMGWGVGLAVGIATLCAMIDNNDSSSSSGSTSH
ncbi:MAG: hypothetical protein COT85_03770 [Chlamydiae bacterium CG10_big_fil_rev_8_21_14_0_10_42_34]|nr:MAG: hypothetical protein COT85_03770 [Chlamydiae bacterium CG10_big_fil_rev_8_21_14_0_10_42_34]